MHPDQATDAIVHISLAHRKAFAVVPCCVFASSHPDRSTPAGEQVTDYVQYIAYLKSLIYTEFFVESLPFSGRNCVLYRIAPSTVASGAS
mmetsp:Transcript_28180/g.45655  ORF Transcript_28180/g.45655 Transcript_28180/m.45655 type:complete len:90 (+) Transcript_28180:857-1126(+)